MWTFFGAPIRFHGLVMSQTLDNIWQLGLAVNPDSSRRLFVLLLPIPLTCFVHVEAGEAEVSTRDYVLGQHGARGSNILEGVH